MASLHTSPPHADSSLRKPDVITVLGGGNGAFATAAHLQLLGARVRLLEAPDLAANIKGIQERNGIELIAENVPGVASRFASLELITGDPRAALDGATIVLYVVPSFCESRFTEFCASYFRPDQLIVLFCGGLGAALELARTLRAKGMQELPTILETEGLVYGAFKKDQTAVRVLAMKKGMHCAALPARKTDFARDWLAAYYPDFSPGADVLETGLRNLNPTIHGPISILNAGRTAPGIRWRYYWDGVSNPVGRVLEEVDKERLAVAGVLEISLPSAADTLIAWYGHQAASGSQLGHILRTNPTYETVWAPESLDHRFLTEDVPFGLVPIEALAKLLLVRTPAITSLITLASSLLGIDFRTCGRHLGRLGMEGMDCAQVKQLARNGLGDKSDA